MSEVEKLCDVIGIIQSGKLLAEGSLASLRAKYQEQDLEEIFVKVVAPALQARGGRLTWPSRTSASSTARKLTEALRDRRTLISTLLVPLLLFPLLSVGFGALAFTLLKKAEEETPKIMLLGGADSPGVLEALRCRQEDRSGARDP